MEASTVHTMRYYRAKEIAVFSKIPGMEELLKANPETFAALERKYPDAVFALMVADNLSTGDMEQNAIHQRAYLAILHGESIAAVQYRYKLDMERYVERHMWDD